MNLLQWWNKYVSLHLRNAEPADTIYVMQIDIKCYDNAWESEDWRKVAMNRQQNVIVITRHSLPIAYAVYELEAAQLKLLRIGVLPKYRRQGIGSSILKWLDRLMGDRGIKRGTCIVPINHTGAANFLKSGGWKVPPKGGIVKDAFEDCGEPIEGLYFIRDKTQTPMEESL
jgi:ribosomal protein S18 acetylase RimI-like enzyme